MSNLKKIIASQDHLLRTLACCEATVAELYTVYERDFPEMGDFWGGLAKEEQKHAALIDEVRNDLESGFIMRGLDHFGVEQVRTLIDYVRDRITESEQKKVTNTQAIAIALSIESSIIDSRFFEFAKSDGSSFQKAAQQLLHDTKDHIQMVQNAMLALKKL